MSLNRIHLAKAKAQSRLAAVRALLANEQTQVGPAATKPRALIAVTQ